MTLSNLAPPQSFTWIELNARSVSLFLSCRAITCALLQAAVLALVVLSTGFQQAHFSGVTCQTMRTPANFSTQPGHLIMTGP